MMCWADKVGVLWAFLVYFGLFVIASDKTAMIETYISGEGLKLFAIFILPVWVILRMIDWIAGGPATRKGRFTGRVIR